MILARVAVCYNVPEALVLTATLNAYGIPVTHTGLLHAWVNWPFLLALGGIELYVPASEAEVSHALLAPSDDVGTDLWETSGFMQHPVRHGVIALLALFLFGAVFPYWVRHWRTGALREGA